MPEEASRKAVLAGMEQGLKPREAARTFYMGGETSALSAAEISQAAKSLPQYREVKGGAKFGVSILSQLSGTFQDSPGELATFAKRFASALLDTKLWKDLGFEGRAGSDPFAQMELLKSKGIKGTQALEAFGFTEEREKIAVAEILNKLPELRKTYKKIIEFSEQPGGLTAKRALAEKELPEMAYERATATAKESLTFSKTFGKEARQARIRDMEQLARGMMLTAKGYGHLVDPESGRIKGWGWQAGFAEAYTADLPIEEEYQAGLKRAGVPVSEGGFYSHPDPVIREKQLVILLETISKYIGEQNKETNGHKKALNENTKVIKDGGMNYSSTVRHPGNAH